MAALLDLRRFKLCLLVSSVLLIFLAVGMIVFGTRQEIIPAHAIDVLSVMVWLGCIISVIPRWLRSKLPYDPFGGEADRTGTNERVVTQSSNVPSHRVVRDYRIHRNPKVTNLYSSRSSEPIVINAAIEGFKAQKTS
jgi:hypothetical protein